MFPILPISTSENENAGGNEDSDVKISKNNSDLNYNLENDKSSQTSNKVEDAQNLDVQMASKLEQLLSHQSQFEQIVEIKENLESLIEFETREGSLKNTLPQFSTIHSSKSENSTKLYQFRANKRDMFSRFLLVSDESLRICEFILQRIANGQNELNLPIGIKPPNSDFSLNKLSGSVLIILEFLDSFRDPKNGNFTDANSDKTYIGCLLKKEFRKLEEAVTLTATAVRILRETFEKVKWKFVNKLREIVVKDFKTSKTIAEKFFKSKMADFDFRFQELQTGYNKGKSALSSESLNGEEIQLSTSFISLGQDGLTFKDNKGSKTNLNLAANLVSSLSYLDRMQVFSKIATSTAMHFKLTRERLYKITQFLKEESVLWNNLKKMLTLMKENRQAIYPTEEGRLLCSVWVIVNLFNRFGRHLAGIEWIIVEAHRTWRQISPNGNVSLNLGSIKKNLKDFMQLKSYKNFEFKLDVYNTDNYDLERETIKTIFSFRVLEKATFPRVVEQRFEILENEAVKFELKITEMKSSFVDLTEEDVSICSDSIQDIFKQAQAISKIISDKKLLIGNLFKDILTEIREEPEKREFLSLNFWIIIFYEILGTPSSQTLKKTIFKITKQSLNFVRVLPNNIRYLKGSFKITKGQVKKITKSLATMNPDLSEELAKVREPMDISSFLKGSKGQTSEEDSAKEDPGNSKSITYENGENHMIKDHSIKDYKIKDHKIKSQSFTIPKEESEENFQILERKFDDELSIYFTQEEGIYFGDSTNRVSFSKLNLKSRLNLSEVIVCFVTEKVNRYENCYKDLKTLFQKSESMENLLKVQRDIEKYKKKRKKGRQELLLVAELEEIILAKIALKLEKDTYKMKSLLKQLTELVKKGKTLIVTLKENLPSLKLKNESKMIENVESRKFLKSLNLEYLECSVKDPTLKAELSKFLKGDSTKKFDLDVLVDTN